MPSGALEKELYHKRLLLTSRVKSITVGMNSVVMAHEPRMPSTSIKVEKRKTAVRRLIAGDKKL